MKQSRTQKAVCAILRSRERAATWKQIHPYGGPEEWKQPRVLSIAQAAKRYKLHISGLLRAVRRAEKFQRCGHCNGKGFIRRSPRREGGV